MQHGSGPTANIKIKSDYTLIALRKIRKGEELLFDYNRIFCLGCKTEARLCNKFGAMPELCSKCNMENFVPNVMFSFVVNVMTNIR